MENGIEKENLDNSKQKNKSNKNYVIVVLVLYVILIGLVVLLVIGLNKQKDTIKNNTNKTNINVFNRNG